MNKNLNKEKWMTILGVILLSGMFYAAWLGFSFFIRSLVSADPKIAAAIIGAMTTVFVGQNDQVTIKAQITRRHART